jgi:hypothetical protein
MTPVDEASPVQFVHTNAGFVLERTLPKKISFTDTDAAVRVPRNDGVSDTFFYPVPLDKQRRRGNA